MKQLKNLIEDLKEYIVEKETHIDHLQKKSNELISFLSKAKDEAIGEFKASNKFIDLLDKNYVAGFEDFCQDAVEAFPGVDFNFIKLRIVAESSLLQTSSEDVNIKDDAFTPLPMKDNSKFGDIAPSGFYKQFLL